MIRRLASVSGTVVLMFAVSLLAIFGRYVIIDPATAMTIGALVLASLLSIIGSTSDSVAFGPLTVPWNVLVGTANIVISVTVVLSTIRAAVVTGDVASWLVAAAMLTVGVAVSWQGGQIARNSRHLDLDETPSSRRFVAGTLLLAGTFGFGVLAGTVV
ncbi:hypothetical protein [Natrinema halophilum]|uniref:Uncharacterized protein n=1 Tax=Natrinema halophilum TaxID=1699371 RepID=A0A7D5GTT5_9EURY|nr:hypothetical protein [Natrinema halophilum]QLG49546.1 hypothetical protein HYG82_12070 [Natrinema halophilum]